MKKIMFNDKYGLTTAVLEGRKIITVRILPLGTPFDNRSETVWQSRYQEGEVVAIAESYKTIYDRLETTDGNSKANAMWAKLSIQSDRSPQLLAGFKNKMFVKAKCMMNCISDIGCMREGIMEGEFMNTRDRFYYDECGDVANHITFKLHGSPLHPSSTKYQAKEHGREIRGCLSIRLNY